MTKQSKTKNNVRTRFDKVEQQNKRQKRKNSERTEKNTTKNARTLERTAEQGRITEQEIGKGEQCQNKPKKHEKTM